MKTAKVLTLYITGNKHHFTNYKPLSTSTILEKCYKESSTIDYTFLEKHKLITDTQY